LATSAEPPPAALPALLLKARKQEWAVRFGRRARDGSVTVAIGDRI